MQLTNQEVLQSLEQAESHAAAGNWMVVQQLCRNVLEAIAKQYPGVIQYERTHDDYRLRIHHEHYDTWGFHFRWVEDAFEYLQLLQELGYEMETEEMSATFYNDLKAEQDNTEEQASRAEWLERMFQDG